MGAGQTCHRFNMAVLQGKSLRKTFPGVVALDDVDIQLSSGRVHALVGANGAGKSTLVKILTGYYEHYEGQVFIDGRPVSLRSPMNAFSNGIEVVHQEVDIELVPSLTVAENLYLEAFATGHSGTVVRSRQLRKKASEDLARIGFPLPVDAKVDELPLHEKQRLVIARALLRNVKFLILDEPTASLSLLEADKLFDLVEDLKNRDVGILYISQRLDEVARVADEVTVLRNGKVVAHFDFVPQLEEIVEAMLDSPQEELFPKKEKRDFGDVVLKVEGLKWRNRVKGVDFSVRRGEILAITGLTGAGKTETLKLIFGALKPDSGEVFLEGRKLKIREPFDAIKMGIYLTPEERRKEGLILDKPARENISLPFLKKLSRSLGVISKTQEVQYAKRSAEKVRLTPMDVERQAQYFSGGNQQKIVVGRWLSGNPKVLLMDEPTQGVDIGAKREIYQLITEIARNSAVVIATSEINEAVGIGDRILVMRDGKVVYEVDRSEANTQELLSYAAGVKS